MDRKLVDKIMRDGENRRARAQRARQKRKEEGRALYRDDAGNPVMRASFVVYLDELGTSARLRAMTDADLRCDLEAYDELRWMLHDESAGWDSESQRTLYFSDNVVIVAPCDPRVHEDDFGLFYKVFSVACYQLNMSIRGRYLRGGIAVGDAYADHSFVTGPAHLQAVVMEEREAINPRVLLDDINVQIARAEIVNGGYANPIDSAYATFLLVDADDRVFVNYLPAANEDEWARPGVTDSGLTSHRQRVVEALEATAGSPDVHAKYEWTAAYHNFVCTDFYGRDDLVIADVPSVAFRRFV
ncbi:hypothetical protein [Nocardioides nematodiphilus]|uniref:hypothetical protein n=1 Tax=Nocardioides nematodiphilus TaxID=2849669 RepID=UPI001CD93C56|nr:hypothetical protein [Nocardioides nematodiphilus]MCA1982199.1 hypothetical protein [Nocardioides nematodiphilus]